MDTIPSSGSTTSAGSTESPESTAPPSSATPPADAAPAEPAPDGKAPEAAQDVAPTPQSEAAQNQTAQDQTAQEARNEAPPGGPTGGATTAEENQPAPPTGVQPAAPADTPAEETGTPAPAGADATVVQDPPPPAPTEPGADTPPADTPPADAPPPHAPLAGAVPAEPGPAPEKPQEPAPVAQAEPEPEPQADQGPTPEERAAALIAAVAGDTKWVEERGKAADPQAVEYWLELAAAAARGKHASDETAEKPAVTPSRRRAAPGAPRTAPPPAPTPRRLAGSTVVTPKYSRFGARLFLLTAVAVVLVVALVGGLITLVAVLTRDHGSTTATAPSVPAPQLPSLGDAKPVLAALSSDAPVPDPAALAARLNSLLGSAALGSGVSAEVLDVASGKVLLDHDAEQPATPASTAKLLTATAVLTTLDPADTIPTRVVAGATPGEVVLVGGGDPTLSRTTPSQSYPGAATIGDLAAQVTKALPPGTQITRVVVDTSIFTGPNTGPGWQPEDTPSSYAAPITPVMVDGGRVSPTSQIRSGSPATDAGKSLAEALGARGVPVVLGQAPQGAKELGMVHSAPIARLVEQALSMSDNVLAEALSRQVALARHQPASFEGSAASVMAAVKEAGVDTTGVQMLDGSGLSRQDRVPARVLADLVAGAAKGKLGTAADLLSGLPVAGYDGTLADRGDADPSTAPGSVRAKTGTLLGVSALAGTVVTADGRLLAFAVVADGVPGSVNAAENALDGVARALATCGCR